MRHSYTGKPRSFAGALDRGSAARGRTAEASDMKSVLTTPAKHPPPFDPD